MANESLQKASLFIDTECRFLHTLNKSDICRFVTDTADCHPDSGYLDYTGLVYCKLQAKLLPLAICFLSVWLLFLFVSLAVAADDFFCPALVVISRTLRLSDNVAGVTLLAFGNGAPDLFSAVAAVTGAHKVREQLAFGALLGGGVFITTVVAGSVCIARPFDMMQRPFMRDVIFFLGAVFMTFCVLYDGKITTVEAVSYILLYVVYVAIVVIARFIYQRRKRQSSTFGQIQEDSTQCAVTPEDVFGADSLDQPLFVPPLTTPQLDNESGSFPFDNVEDDEVGSILADESTPLLGQNQKYSTTTAVKDLFLAICPVDLEGWKHGGFFRRALAVIKIIPLLVYTLSVPLVDYSSDNNNNWNMHLNCFHCIFSPVLTLYLANSSYFFFEINGVFPVWAVVLIGSFLVSMFVFLTSVPSKPPAYHFLFSYFGFLVAIVWIQTVANELVNLLQAMGIIFDWTEAVLGLTILAWGNSIGDLIADTTMAKKGFPKTGISACYGGPMFNILLGVGIPFTIVCIEHDGVLEISLSVAELLLVAALIINLSLALVIVPFLLKFHMTRSFGFFLYGIYAVFLCLAVLIGSNVIKDQRFGRH